METSSGLGAPLSQPVGTMGWHLKEMETLLPFTEAPTSQCPCSQGHLRSPDVQLYPSLKSPSQSCLRMCCWDNSGVAIRHGLSSTPPEVPTF